MTLVSSASFFFFRVLKKPDFVLQILDLSSNLIRVLPTLMLHPLPAIETLYLEFNKV